MKKISLAPRPFHVYSRGGNPPPVVKQQPKTKPETPWGDIPASIENALRDYGPMTSAELVLYVPGLPNDIRKACQRMLKPSKRAVPVGQQRIHISGWTRDAEGQRDYPRAIYALGHGENKPKPKAKKRRDVVREWDQTTKARLRNNFVFNLAGTPCPT